MTDEAIKAVGGTPRGSYNAASHGPQGEGVQHLFYNLDGVLIEERWDLPRNSTLTSATTHGLYSGSGSITYQGNGQDYDFNWQPIDIADAIAKVHDMDYAEAVRIGGPSQGYVEDVRTLQAEIDMLDRLDLALNGANWENLNIERPFRDDDLSGEARAALNSQKAFIGMLALWKGWKINQPNQGAGIDIFDEEQTEEFINDVSGNRFERSIEKGKRKIVVDLLQRAETMRQEGQNQN